jgi:hypothetical protein
MTRARDEIIKRHIIVDTVNKAFDVKRDWSELVEAWRKEESATRGKEPAEVAEQAQTRARTAADLAGNSDQRSDAAAPAAPSAGQEKMKSKKRKRRKERPAGVTRSRPQTGAPQGADTAGTQIRPHEGVNVGESYPPVAPALDSRQSVPIPRASANAPLEQFHRGLVEVEGYPYMGSPRPLGSYFKDGDKLVHRYGASFFRCVRVVLALLTDPQGPSARTHCRTGGLVAPETGRLCHCPAAYREWCARGARRCD